MKTPEALVITEMRDFDAFFRGHYRAVTGLALVLSGDLGCAEDVAQDAFAAAHRSWDRVGRYDDPGAWVRRVVANKAASLRRRRSAERRAVNRYSLMSTESRPSAGFDEDEIWREVRRLPKRQAQVVALMFLEELSAAEVAHVLGCGEATVRTHLHRAKATLARRLDLNDDAEEDD
jgi:RNA polymerase sigma-70 factor (ECF subfamily)